MSVLAVNVGAYAGPAGLVLVLLMFVATAVLIRNMDKRVKRLPRDFSEPTPEVTRDEPGPGAPPV